MLISEYLHLIGGTSNIYNSFGPADGNDGIEQNALSSNRKYFGK